MGSGYLMRPEGTGEPAERPTLLQLHRRVEANARSAGAIKMRRRPSTDFDRWPMTAEQSGQKPGTRIMSRREMMIASDARCRCIASCAGQQRVPCRLLMARIGQVRSVGIHTRTHSGGGGVARRSTSGYASTRCAYVKVRMRAGLVSRACGSRPGVRSRRPFHGIGKPRLAPPRRPSHAMPRPWPQPNARSPPARPPTPLTFAFHPESLAQLVKAAVCRFRTVRRVTRTLGRKSLSRPT